MQLFHIDAVQYFQMVKAFALVQSIDLTAPLNQIDRTLNFLSQRSETGDGTDRTIKLNPSILNKIEVGEWCGLVSYSSTISAHHVDCWKIVSLQSLHNYDGYHTDSTWTVSIEEGSGWVKDLNLIINWSFRRLIGIASLQRFVACDACCWAHLRFCLFSSARFIARACSSLKRMQNRSRQFGKTI